MTQETPTYEDLLEAVAVLREMVAALRTENATLRTENAELKRRLGMNSSNSSKPPSSEPPWSKLVGKGKRSKLTRGGQQGHEGHQRSLLDEKEIDAVVVCAPPDCPRCGAGETELVRVWRHQVWELVDRRPQVTEYRVERRRCGCGVVRRGKLPAGVTKSVVGPRLMAVVVLLTGEYRLSKRAASRLVNELYRIKLALGTIANIERRGSAATEPAHAEAKVAAQQSKVPVHADETSAAEASVRKWLWVAVTPLVAYFCILSGRDTAAAKELLGENFAGRLVSDQHGAYNWIDARSRQLCWAHLFRKFQGFADQGGVNGVYGQSLLDKASEIFTDYHRVRDGTLPRDEWIADMNARLIPEFEALLLDAACSELPRLANACAQLYRDRVSLWLFARDPDVEPTNNTAERALRHAVIWRKTSFGTQSDAGSRFVERILTVVATLRLQQRSVLDFLHDAIVAHDAGSPAPVLIPA